MPKRHNETPSKHVEMLRAQLREYKGQFGALERCTGIPRNWLNQFSQGVFCDPGAGRIETLARALGYEVRYARVRAAFKPKQRQLDEAAVRKSINNAVYGAEVVQ